MVKLCQLQAVRVLRITPNQLVLVFPVRVIVIQMANNTSIAAR